MAFTQQDLDRLDVAYRAGSKTVRGPDGRALERYSVDEYIKLRNLMLNDIAQQSGATKLRQVQVFTDPGW